MNLRQVTATSVILLMCGAASAQVSDESRAFADELRADASYRTSMLDDPAKAFVPKVGGFMMARYNVNSRNDDNLDPANGNKKITQGAQMAYIKMQINGNVVSDAWGYGVQFKFSESTGEGILDDAYITFKPEDQWAFKVGQFKAPLLREENMSDTKQLSANRSVMNSVFTQSRSQGIGSSYTGDKMRYSSMISDGLRTANTDYNSTAEADYGLTGRIEYKWDGDWKQYDEFTSFPGSHYFGAVSGSFHYQSGEKTTYTLDAKIIEGTFDVMVKGNGWNMFAAVIMRATEAFGSSTFNDKGFMIQGGYFITPQWELFGRYDSVQADSDRPLTHDAFNTVTFGANKYISPNSHAVKLTFDVEYFLDAQSQSIANQSTLTGLLASSSANQWAFQAQLQMMF